MSVLPRSALAALAVGAVITATGGAAIAAPSGTHSLPGSVPSWATAANRVSSAKIST